MLFAFTSGDGRLGARVSGGDDAGAGCGADDERSGFAVGARPVDGARVLRDRLRPLCGNQRNGATTETATGESRAERARVDEALDERVEIRCRHLHVVAQRRVTGEHEPAEGVDVAVPERTGELVHPHDLGDDVPRARLVGDGLGRGVA